MRVPSLSRGAVVWADLNPVIGHEQAGHRPVVLVSDDRFNARSGTAIVMPLTSKKPRAGYPFAVQVGEVGGEGAVSYVKPGQVRTLSTSRLGKLMGAVGEAHVNLLVDALWVICGRHSLVSNDVTVALARLGKAMTHVDALARVALLEGELELAKVEAQGLRGMIKRFECKYAYVRRGNSCDCCVARVEELEQRNG